MKILAIPVILLVGALVFNASTSRAIDVKDINLPTWDTTQPMPEDVAAELTEWLNQRAIPVGQWYSIVVIPQRQLSKMVYGGGGGRARGGCHDGIIYLSDMVDLDTVSGKSVLLHELVHTGQRGSESDKVCPKPANLSERELFEEGAYRAQERYLADNGIEYHFDKQASLRGR